MRKLALFAAAAGLAAAGLGTAPAASAHVELTATGYHYANYNSGKCADVRDRSTSDKALLQQYTCQTGPTHLNQLFRWESYDGSGYYSIIAAHSDKCLDVRDRSHLDGAVVQQYTCHQGPNQQWSITGGPFGGTPSPGPNKWYRIHNRNSGKCLEVNLGSENNNALLVQRTCNASHQQLWNAS